MINLTNRPLKKKKPHNYLLQSYPLFTPVHLTLPSRIPSSAFHFSSPPIPPKSLPPPRRLPCISSLPPIFSLAHAYTGVIHPACFLASVLEDNVLIAASLLAVINCSADVSPHPCLAAGSDPGATLLPVGRASSAIDAIESESLLTDLGSGTTTTPIPVPAIAGMTTPGSSVMRVVDGLTDKTTKNDDDSSHNDDDIGDGRGGGGDRRKYFISS